VVTVIFREPGSSVSIVRTGRPGFLSPTEAEDFSSTLCAQAPGAHPVSCTMGTGCSSAAGEVRPGRDADHLPPSSSEIKKEWELYLLSPKKRLYEAERDHFTFFTHPQIALSRSTQEE
jgi:hypothetical protein